MKSNKPIKANIKQISIKQIGIKLLVAFSLLLVLIGGLAKEARAVGASLYLSPSSGTFFVGSTFDVSIFVNTGREDINAVEVNVKFDPQKLQVASPTAGKSFIEVWVSQPVYDNIRGEMSFLGGIPSPGINTTAGLVSTVTFRAMAPGETAILFFDNSKVLRNDAQGTDILTSMGRGVYNLIIPPPAGPRVYSLTHPDTNKWYKDNNPTFCWEKEEGVTDFSYSFDQDSTGIPDNVSEGDHTCVSYSDVEDGIWYFHVKARKEGVWGGSSHYSLRIDTTPPALFTPTIEPGEKTIEKQPIVSFITTDALSGICHYELKYIDITPEKKEETVGFFREVSSPYQLPSLEIGKHLIVIRAYDIAGNFREGTVKIEVLPRGIFISRKGIQYRQFLILWWILILILIIILTFTLRSLWKRKKEKELFEKKQEKLERKFSGFTEDKKENINQILKREKNTEEVGSREKKEEGEKEEKRGIKKESFFIIFFLVFCFFFFPLPVLGDQASFYFSPATGSYRMGENFSLNLFVNTGGVAINAAQATIKFPPGKLEVVNLSKSASIFTLWIQEPSWSNSRGEIFFGGGLPSPGYRGEAGRIITIFFRGKSEGEARVNLEKEIITANDPWGTNVFSFSQEGNFLILPKEDLPEEESPEELREEPIYMAPIIDTEPPLPFEIIIDDEGDPTNPQPLLYFETRDELSGMSHYEVKINEEDFYRVAVGETMPHRLSFLSPETHQITVKAFDKAGNYIDSTAKIKTESIPVPEITICPQTYQAGEEMLYIGGRAVPGYAVIVFLKTDDSVIKTWNVLSDEKGEWFLTEEGLFRPGTYKVIARARDSRGALSDFSEECVIEIFLGGFMVGPWLIDYQNLTLILFLVLVIILLAVFYLFYKIKRTQKILARETKDLKQKFHKEYKELTQDIEKELEVLRKLRGKKEITEEEKKRERKLLKNLADVEEVLRKELKDIEEIK